MHACDRHAIHEAGLATAPHASPARAAFVSAVQNRRPTGPPGPAPPVHDLFATAWQVAAALLAIQLRLGEALIHSQVQTFVGGVDATEEAACLCNNGSICHVLTKVTWKGVILVYSPTSVSAKCLKTEHDPP